MSTPTPSLTSSPPNDILAYMNQPPLHHETCHISGNATPALKALAFRWHALLHQSRQRFVISVSNRVKITDVSILGDDSEPGAPKRARVVCEVFVTQDMLDRNGRLHQEIAFLLMDECSVLPLALLDFVEDENARGMVTLPGVSRAINSVLHSTSKPGDKLRIVTTSMPGGARSQQAAMSSQCEIWDDKNHRLVASAVQMAMQPTYKVKL